MIQLDSEQLKTIYTHAESTYPEECCGLLLGKRRGDSKTVVEVWQTENAWDAEAVDNFQAIARAANLGLTKRSNFAIAPEAMLKAQKEARDRHLDIVGIYHSHPDHPAMPSEFDRAIAWQGYSYIIVSVQQGKTADLKSWCLDDAHQFQPEEILAVEPA